MNNVGKYQTTTIGAKKAEIDKLMTQLARLMDELGYELEIKFKKKQNDDN